VSAIATPSQPVGIAAAPDVSEWTMLRARSIASARSCAVVPADVTPLTSSTTCSARPPTGVTTLARPALAARGTTPDVVAERYADNTR
jgi:hypothetical protein